MGSMAIFARLSLVYGGHLGYNRQNSMTPASRESRCCGEEFSDELVKRA